MNPFRLSVRLRPGSRGGGPDPPSSSVAPAEYVVAGGTAVAVPWRVVGRSASAIEIEHVGDGPRHSARFALAGEGLLGLSLPRTVLPGERLRVVVRGAAGARAATAADAMLVLRWFEPDGREMLWPIAL